VRIRSEGERDPFVMMVGRFGEAKGIACETFLIGVGFWNERLIVNRIHSPNHAILAPVSHRIQGTYVNDDHFSTGSTIIIIAVKTLGELNEGITRFLLDIFCRLHST
jgi:hypothetical protein